MTPPHMNLRCREKQISENTKIHTLSISAPHNDTPHVAEPASVGLGQGKERTNQARPAALTPLNHAKTPPKRAQQLQQRYINPKSLRSSFHASCMYTERSSDSRDQRQRLSTKPTRHSRSTQPPTHLHKVTSLTLGKECGQGS